MSKKMRRTDRALSPAQTEDVLRRGEYGTLAMTDGDGHPYAVSLSYVYSGGHIYFHCAPDGHKLDCIRRDPRVCFSVATDTQLRPEELTTAYSSAIVFGTAEEVYGSEKQDALRRLTEKYAPEYMDVGEKCIARRDSATIVVRITVRRMTGKANV